MLYDEYFIDDVKNRAVLDAAAKSKKMKLWQIFVIATLFFFIAPFSIGQTIEEESNWYSVTGRGSNPYTEFEYRRYQKTDVRKAAAKYLQIKGRKELDEWEGEYRRGVMLGAAELIWSVSDGYVKAFTYHTLLGLDYGTAISTEIEVHLNSEKPVPTSQQPKTDKLVKVKFGDIHFLIPQNKLRHFAQRAAGFISNPDENDYVWIKTSDEQNKVYGIPIFPKRFSNLIVRPLKMRVTLIGEPRLHQDKFENGEVYAEYNNRFVNFDAGRTKGLRLGMFVYSDDLDEWIEIVKVNRTNSVGLLSRSLSKSRQEICWEENGRQEERPCRVLRSGVYVRTLSREFNF